MRRSVLALLISFAIHAGMVGIAVGVGLLRTMSFLPVVRLNSVSVDIVRELPLGKLPSGQDKPAALPTLPLHKPRPRMHVAKDSVTVAASPDAGVNEKHADAATGPRTPLPRDAGPAVDGGRRRPGDLRSNGPEGSRLLALLRLDRLRATPSNEKIVAAVDQLLRLLPDRRRLIEGTDLDLYRDFDSLLIATPNPADDAVTFLAVRHHLSDAALKAALERGALAAHRPIRWRTVRGRPVGMRQRVENTSAGPVPLDRDDRILALPQASLAIMATPAYAAQFLATAPSGKESSSDAGLGAADGAHPSRKRSDPMTWEDLVARLDAEESALPEDAVFMMAATKLFAGSSPVPALVVPATRGASEDSFSQALGGEVGRVPEVLTVVAGLSPPHLEVLAEFGSVSDAEGWERSLPAWKRRLLSNPVVFLSGFSALVGRAEISREGVAVQLQVDPTVEEFQRLLSLMATLTRAASLARP